MQGPALGWYKWLHSTQQLTTWDAFTRALELRFGPSTFENHQTALFKSHQTGSVTDYQAQFETLSNRVNGLSSELLLNCFLSGLRNDIQRDLAVLRPKSFPDAIGLAKLLEDKIQDAKHNPQRFARVNPTTTNQPTPSILDPAPQTNNPPIRKISPAEIADRHAKGLCYNCDEKWVAGHRC